MFKYAIYLKKNLNFMKKTTFLIVGKHAVIEALKNSNRKIEKVFVTEEAKKNVNREYQNTNLFKNISVIYKSKIIFVVVRIFLIKDSSLRQKT